MKIGSVQNKSRAGLQRGFKSEKTGSYSAISTTVSPL
jgi:hypothetical protein